MSNVYIIGRPPDLIFPHKTLMNHTHIVTRELGPGGYGDPSDAQKLLDFNQMPPKVFGQTWT